VTQLLIVHHGAEIGQTSPSALYARSPKRSPVSTSTESGALSRCKTGVLDKIKLWGKRG
jgi:hypothetical protein